MNTVGFSIPECRQVLYEVANRRGLSEGQSRAKEVRTYREAMAKFNGELPAVADLKKYTYNDLTGEVALIKDEDQPSDIDQVTGEAILLEWQSKKRLLLLKALANGITSESSEEGEKVFAFFKYKAEKVREKTLGRQMSPLDNLLVKVEERRMLSPDVKATVKLIRTLSPSKLGDMGEGSASQGEEYFGDV